MRWLAAVFVMLLPLAAAAETTGAPPGDDALYSCNSRTGEVEITFKPEVE